MAPYQNNSFNNRGTPQFSNKPAQSQSWNRPTGQAQLQGGNRPSRPEDTPRILPTFDIKTLTKELFDTIADKCAKTISESSDSVNKPTQLRRFYDELVMWNERAAKSEQSFKDALPVVYMMKSKVAYAKGRKNVDSTFQEFINKTIDQINDQKTLNNAKLFMEAMMGFYKQYKKD